MPPDTGQVTVGGAFAVVAVDPAQLQLAAATIGGAGLSLAEVAATVSRIVGQSPALAALSAPATQGLVLAKAMAVTIGPEGLLPLAARLELHAQTLQIAADAYALAESSAAALADTVQIGQSLHQLLATAPPTAVEALQATWTDESPVQVLSRWASRNPELVDAMVASTDLIGHALPGTFEDHLGVALGYARGHGLLTDRRPLTVGEAPSYTRQPATTIGGLLRSDDQVEHSGTLEHSAIRIHHIVHGDGTGGWIVDLPGTESWSPTAGPNPSDAAANLAGMAGVGSSIYPAVTAALRTSMRRAGVTPGAQPVMLVGHSQGGILATRLAQDDTFRRTFDVRQVVTAGSPVSRITLPAGVTSFDLEHAEDIVPRLDGTDAPRDQRNRVSLHARATPRPGDAKSPVSTHPGRRYAETADRLAGRDSRDTNVREFYRRNAVFLDEHARDDVYDYTLRRPPAP